MSCKTPYSIPTFLSQSYHGKESKCSRKETDNSPVQNRTSLSNLKGVLSFQLVEPNCSTKEEVVIGSHFVIVVSLRIVNKMFEYYKVRMEIHQTSVVVLIGIGIPLACPNVRFTPLWRETISIGLGIIIDTFQMIGREHIVPIGIDTTNRHT